MRKTIERRYPSTAPATYSEGQSRVKPRRTELVGATANGASKDPTFKSEPDRSPKLKVKACIEPQRTQLQTSKQNRSREGPEPRVQGEVPTHPSPKEPRPEL